MADSGVQAADGEPAGDADWRSGIPVAAFVLTSMIVAVGISAVVLSRVWGSGPEATFDFNRDVGWIIVAFVFFWALTIFAGLIFGVPVLLGLRKVGLDRRLEALVPAGGIAGTLFVVLMGFIFSGDFLAFTSDPSLVAIGGSAGLAAGALWWLFARRQRNTNG